MDCQPKIMIPWSPRTPQRRIYRKLLITRRKGLAKDELLPGLSCEAKAQVDPSHLDAYRELCAIAKSSDLPLLYPYVMMGSAHLQIASDPRFPLKSLGVLHLRNHIVQTAPIPSDASLDLACGIRRQRVVDKGLEFDIDSEVYVDGTMLWHSVSTLLKLGQFGTPDPETTLDDGFAEIPDAESQLTIQVPADMGRKYARVTGDYNPIHISKIAARIFGYRTAIAHGMWTVARSLASLSFPVTTDPCRLDVAFKGPVFLGSTVDVRRDKDRIDLYCGDNPRPVVKMRR